MDRAFTEIRKKVLIRLSFFLILNQEKKLTHKKVLENLVLIELLLYIC